MRLIRRLSLVFVGVLLFLASATGGANAHWLGEDSVDGRDLAYEDYTRWDDALNWSIARWEEIPGDVNIFPDNAGSITDLEVGDYRSDDGRCGYWDGLAGADVLRLNNRYFDGYHGNDRRNCMVHEWGHAQGLAHSYWDQVMDSCPVEACGRSFDRPQGHDRSDYDYSW